ncbi:hypothetical protein IWX49DRAFT_587890 [Phyllosticta citricarpa]|uniref:Uncharacterized protein n=1 Tax=Phyllosticta paracitricarpa TaxID=2016321 RepID=A0ABR1NGF8_9PEZI
MSHLFLGSRYETNDIAVETTQKHHLRHRRRLLQLDATDNAINLAQAAQTDGGVVVRDNFAQLLAYEVTGDLDLFELDYSPRSWNYFVDSDKGFPNDVDTTSYAYHLLPLDPEWRTRSWTKSCPQKD